METEELGTIEIRRLAAVLRRWLWLIVLGTVLAAGAAFAFCWWSVPVYQASTTLLINEGEKATGPDYNAILMSERLAKTYTQVLKSKPILDEAGARLHVLLEPRAVTVNPVRDTQLIRLDARHTDPNLAAAIANTIPKVFSDRNGALQSARFAASQESLSREMEALQKQMDAADRELQAERARRTPSTTEVARLEALLAQYRSTYAGLLASYEEIRVAEARGSSTITVVEPAEVPLEPVLPRTRMNTLLAGAVGAMLATALAFLIEYLDDTIKSPADVERSVHLPTYASIPLYRSAAGETVRPLMAAEGQSVAAESYRLLRTNLAFSTLGMGHSAVVLLMTSAQPGEGKTTTVANLGVSLAQTGKTVLLVDADLRHPTLHRQFGLPNRPGLTSLILGAEGDLQGVLQETGVKNLRLLTTGHLPANPAEVLSFPQTDAVLDRLRPLFDYILLDAPPLLLMADATSLARKADGVVVVAEMGRTRSDALVRALSALEGVKARVLGVVINKVKARWGSYYQDYYQHYHSYYGGDEARKGRKQHSRGPARPLFGRAPKPARGGGAPAPSDRG